MKAKSLDELEALLASEAFRTWWGDIDSFRSERREVEERLEEAADRLFHLEIGSERKQRDAFDIVQDAPEDEHLVAGLHADATEIENRANEKLARFEEQRYRASDAWVRLGALEKKNDEIKERVEQAKAGGGGDVSRLQTELDRIVRDHRSAHEAYERLSEKKQRLWREVEMLWSESLEKSLNAAEREARVASKKCRAERLLRSSELDLDRASELKEEMKALKERLDGLEDRIRHCLADAPELFDAITGEDFIYWPCQNADKQVWCLSLTGAQDRYNIEVAPKTLYRAKAAEGVGHLEPLSQIRDEVHQEDRIEAWFRHGAPRAPEVAVGEEADQAGPEGEGEVVDEATGG